MTERLPTIDEGSRAQLEKVTQLLHRQLGESILGVYLFGSAALGGLKPDSDLDIMTVAQVPTTELQRIQLIHGLLALSTHPRHIELTIVVQRDVRPWRSPPLMDFQYGDWWRTEFEHGETRPWGSSDNPDLATLIRMVLIADEPLHGPRPAEVLDPIPRTVYSACVMQSIDDLVADLEWDTRNVLLTLVRIWHTMETDEIVPKHVAASWAAERLPGEQAHLVAEAGEMYLGEREDWRRPPLRRAAYLTEQLISRVKQAASTNTS
jgi:predicted nucleotidyltransferase